MKLFHGAHTTFELHAGQCFTDDLDSADTYTQSAGQLAAVNVSFASLLVIDCTDIYDHDADTAPGDDGNDFGGDVLMYSDEDASGRSHTTWRLMSNLAVDAVSIISTSIRCDCCGEWTSNPDEFDQCGECR